jgi:hypothetical protein
MTPPPVAVGPLKPPGPGFPPDGEVFTFGPEHIGYRDLALVSTLARDWDAFLARAARGLALAGASGPDNTAVDRALLGQHTARFRRERHLESADDLRAWLEARSLTRTEWQEALGRALLLERADEGIHPQPGASAGEVAAPPAGGETDARPPVTALRADAFCTGLWAGAAARAADWLAAARLAPDQALRADALARAQRAGAQLGLEPTRAEAFARWSASYDALSAEAEDDRHVSRVLRQRELDWTTFELEELALDSEQAAREALLCSRDDGLEIGELEARTAARRVRRQARASSLPPTVAAGLFSAKAAGGPLGPFAAGPEWRVVWLRSSQRPTEADPAWRREAAQQVLRERLDRELAGRLHWTGPV